VPLGATGPASGTILYPAVLNSLIGTRFSVVPGYRHTEMLLAMERGETGGAHTSLTTLKSSFPSWLAQNKVNMLVVCAPQRLPELTNVPDLIELADGAEDRAVLAIVASVGAVGRSILTTPRVPPERIAALRVAFQDMLRDGEFLADLRKTHAEFGPLDGAALQAFIAGTRNVAPEVLERVRAPVPPSDRDAGELLQERLALSQANAVRTRNSTVRLLQTKPAPSMKTYLLCAS